MDLRDLDMDERRRLYKWVLYKAHLIARPDEAKDLTQRAFVARTRSSSGSKTED